MSITQERDREETSSLLLPGWSDEGGFTAGLLAVRLLQLLLRLELWVEDSWAVS